MALAADAGFVQLEEPLGRLVAALACLGEDSTRHALM
jgi:hypothetical protein